MSRSPGDPLHVFEKHQPAQLTQHRPQIDLPSSCLLGSCSTGPLAEAQLYVPYKVCKLPNGGCSPHPIRPSRRIEPHHPGRLLLQKLLSPTMEPSHRSQAGPHLITFAACCCPSAPHSRHLTQPLQLSAGPHLMTLAALSCRNSSLLPLGPSELSSRADLLRCIPPPGPSEQGGGWRCSSCGGCCCWGC